MAQNKTAPVFLIICEGVSDREVLRSIRLYIMWKYHDASKTIKPKIEIFYTDGDTLETYKKDKDKRIIGKYIHSECTDLIAERIKGDISDLVNSRKIPLDSIRAVFMVTDTDGVFISDDDIFPDSPYNAKTYYGDDGIYTHSYGKRKSIIERNAMKRDNIEWIRRGNPIHITIGENSRDFPIRLYYMSCNLDHVIVDDSNNYGKFETAANWLERMIISRSEQKVYDFFDNRLPSSGNYKESWAYISEFGTKRSLERGTNCKFILDTLDAYIQRQLVSEVKSRE